MVQRQGAFLKDYSTKPPVIELFTPTPPTGVFRASPKNESSYVLAIDKKIAKSFPIYTLLSVFSFFYGIKGSS